MKKSNRKIYQIYYGRIITLISAICIICAGILYYFQSRDVIITTTLTVEVSPFYMIKDNNKSGNGFVTDKKDSEFLYVFFTAYEADILVVTQNAKGKDYSVLALTKKLELPASSVKKDNSMLTRLIKYPYYTVSKINELNSSYEKNEMIDELKLYAISRIYDDFYREYRKVLVRSDGNFLSVYKIYLDIKNTFDKYKPSNTDDFTKKLNILACALTHVYFEGINNEFSDTQLI